MPSKFLLLEEAADLLRLPEPDVVDLIESGELSALVVNEQVRISPAHLRRFIQSHTSPFVKPEGMRRRAEVATLRKMWRANGNSGR